MRYFCKVLLSASRFEDSNSEAAEEAFAAYKNALDDLERDIQLLMIAVKLVISVITFVATRGSF